MSDQITLSNKEQALNFFRGTSTDTSNQGDNGDAAAKAEKERLEKEAADKKAAEDAEAARLEAEKAKNTPSLPELTDEQLFELMAKKAGRSFSSWDELKPKKEEVDKAKEAEEREADKIAYGLKKGLFNKNQLESYFTDSKDKVGVVYAAELSEAKKNDPEWNEDKENEFKEEFNAEYGLGLDDSAAKKQRGQRKLNVLAETILKSQYSSIYDLENQYSKHESDIKSRNEREQKILSGTPVYKQDVQDVVASFSEIELPLGKDQKYKVPVPQEALQNVKDMLMDDEFVQSQIEKGYSKKDIEDVARTMILSENLPELIQKVVEQHQAKNEKGVRGIPPAGTLDSQHDDYAGLTDRQQQAIKFFKANNEKPIGAN